MKWYERWICYWADMLAGLVGVLTLTFYRPRWDYNAICYFSIRTMKRRIKEKNK